MVRKIKRRRRRQLLDYRPKRQNLRRIFRADDYAEGFDAHHAQTLVKMHHWPEGGVEAILRYVERFVRYGDRVIGYDPISEARAPLDPLPTPLLDALIHLSDHTMSAQRLDAFIDDKQAHALWQQITHRARELSLLDEHPSWGDLTQLSAWELFEVIVIIVAEGMTYTKGVLGTDLNFEVSQGASWLEGFELFLVSLFKVFTADFRSILWLAKQPFKRGFTGMCRHYSLLVQVLFSVAKRVLGQHEHAHVVTISGTHEFLVKYDHAWTWFVDNQTGQIIPVDLTGADWLYDRQMANSIFNEGFDAYRFNNTSAFIHCLCAPLATTVDGYHDKLNALTALMPNLIDPQTVHGQALLMNWMRQNLFPDSVRQRIVRHIDQHDERLVGILQQGDSSWAVEKSRQMLDDSGLHAILDALEIR